MKTSKFFSLFLFGLLVTGMVHAQEAEVTTMSITAEPVMAQEAEDMMPMHTMMRGGEMEGEHEGCSFFKGKKMTDGSGDCPMKKMMKSGSHHGGMILWKLLRGLGCLVFLFLGAAVIRKGWAFGGKSFKCCGGKSCKK